MTEQIPLSEAQVRAAGVPDWRQILDRLKACFRTGDFDTGLALTNEIGRITADAERGPDVTLTRSAVVVALSPAGARAVTERDVELAGRISAAAAALGVAADPARLTQLELGLDTAGGAHLAPFYAALLGAELLDDEPVDPSGQVPTVWWQNPEDPVDASALPAQAVEQRWHLDVWVAHDEAEHRLRAVLDAGGRLVSEVDAPAYWVVEDADGNRSCICTSAGR